MARAYGERRRGKAGLFSEAQYPLCLICRSESRPLKEVGPTLFTTEKWGTMSSSEYGLSFSAHDLLMRLVRENRAIRGKITKPPEPLWLHHGSYPEATVQIADVRELLQHRLIEFSAKWFQRGEELYKASNAGIKAAGPEAIAHARRSATLF